MALVEWDVTGGSGGGADVKSGVEAGITEGASRAVAFGTAFASVPTVVVSLADASLQLTFVQAHSITKAGFVIQVVKSGGGGNVTRDVAWTATSAGNA